MFWFGRQKKQGTVGGWCLHATFLICNVSLTSLSMEEEAAAWLTQTLGIIYTILGSKGKSALTDSDHPKATFHKLLLFPLPCLELFASGVFVCMIWCHILVCDLKPKWGREGGGRALTFFSLSLSLLSNGNLGMGDNRVKNVGSNPLCLGVRPLRFHHFIRKWLISPLEKPDKDSALMQGESKFKQPSMFWCLTY